jgi:predicted nicotinamide N-methyase
MTFCLVCNCVGYRKEREGPQSGVKLVSAFLCVPFAFFALFAFNCCESSLCMPFPLELRNIKVGDVSVELFVPDLFAIQQAWKKGMPHFPYWSQVWPSAIAMSQFLLKHPELYKDKQVLEIAAGLGLPSLVIANSARSVLCTDMDAEAVATIQRSVNHQQIKNVTCSTMDWNHLPEGLHPGLLLLSDINYDATQFSVLHGVLQHFLQQGTMVLLSTPQRLIAKSFIEPLLPYSIGQEVFTVAHEKNEVQITVMVLEDHNSGNNDLSILSF